MPTILRSTNRGILVPVDYEKIREENLDRYGWDIERVAQMAFADSYADRTHFIFELLQNAEDAIGRRGASWTGGSAVSFLLSQNLLRVGHYGAPFNEDDVRGICGIGESTKSGDYTTIGRFGIGFKSVYAFTRHPEIHSGDEDFVVEKFVQPKSAEPIQQNPNETVFLIPLDRDSHIDDNDKIGEALADLDVRSLLFLKKIEELHWEVEGCDSGQYLRDVEIEDNIARRVKVIGHTVDLSGKETEINEEWIVFSRGVEHDGKEAGHVEIAFCVDEDTGKICRLDESKLVVYFPTVVETHLGFLVQGPYRTTPNRDNVPPDDEWNEYLVNETAELLSEVLVWLRDRDMLDVNVLESLPLTQYSDSRFDPLFDQTKATLLNEDVLPRYGGGFVSGSRAALGDSEGLRRLFTSSQLSGIFGQQLSWLTGSITPDRSREVWHYLTEELGVREIRPEYVLRELTESFLIDQNNEWIVQLYEFLADQRALHAQFKSLPLIRLEDGSHVSPQTDGRPNAYLPSDVETEFPSVKKEICLSDNAVRFLESMGIKHPDVVDDVIANVLPKYEDTSSAIPCDQYESDINRILNAFSKAQGDDQQRRLIDELSAIPWVGASDTGHGRRHRVRPSDVYLVTEKVKTVFEGVSGVLTVDDGFDCLTGDGISDLLTRCDAIVDFAPIEIRDSSRFTESEREQMRIEIQQSAGYPIGEWVRDWRVLGLEVLLRTISELQPDQRYAKARILWEAMSDWRESQTWGTYGWSHRTTRSYEFNSEFIEQLSEIPWIPSSGGSLRRPAEVDFDTLGWVPNSTLQARLPFKPSEIKILAEKLDFEPDVLELLKRHDLTTISKLREAGIFDDQLGADVHAVQTKDLQENFEPFAKQLFEIQTKSPMPERERPVLLPEGGPKTGESAKLNAQRSTVVSGSGSRRRISGTRWIPTEASDDLSQKFRQMVLGDYGRRCQLCSNAFTKPDGELQVYVMHIVPPSKDGRANNFGDLVGVCGWHHALFKYGEWAFDFAENRGGASQSESFEDWQVMRANIQSARRDIDDYGNPFVPIPIQFSNVFKDWVTRPEVEKTVIRYSVPHWKHLCELLKV